MVTCPPNQQLASPRSLALQGLRWLHLEVTHELLHDLALSSPIALGTLFRSVWGLALHERSPEAFEPLFGSIEETYRPWWWRIPHTKSGTYLPAGTVLSSRLSLQDTVWQHLGACVGALADFSRHGLGADRVPAVLQQVRLVGPEGISAFKPNADQHAWNADAVWQQAQTESAQLLQPSHLHVKTNSPLRLKEGGQLLRHAPDLATWLLRSMGRIQMMLPQGMGALLTPEQKKDWLMLGQTIPACGAQIWPMHLPRYSARQQHAMTIEGMEGHWFYGPEAQVAWPWFRLIEHLQFGGKTTLGFGSVSVWSEPISSAESPLKKGSHT